MRDALSAEVAQALGVELGAVASDDEGCDLLAVALVGNRDDLNVGYVRVTVEELLDLAWIHILSAADDHVLGASNDADVTVSVHRREIAGVHPARVVDSLCRLVRLVPV